MKIFLALSTLVFLVINCNSQPDRRIQKVVEKDSTGRILKTFDGFVYRNFDINGRLIESWGNPKRTDFDGNFRDVYEITDSVIIIKEYFFERKNTKCKIVDSLDCYISKLYHKDGKLLKTEHWNPMKDKKNKVIKHILVETDDDPRQFDFIGYLPPYLRKKD
jgi:hypothetical protein